MAEQTVQEEITHRWYARPVFFVADLNRSLDFYLGKLGFWKKWHKGTVCQVNRSDCEIILCQDAARHDRSRLFVELTRQGVEQLVQETIERSVPTQKSWWGYDVIVIVDPDGHELLIPLEE